MTKTIQEIKSKFAYKKLTKEGLSQWHKSNISIVQISLLGITKTHLQLYLTFTI